MKYDSPRIPGLLNLHLRLNRSVYISIQTYKSGKLDITAYTDLNMTVGKRSLGSKVGT